MGRPLYVAGRPREAATPARTSLRTITAMIMIMIHEHEHGMTKHMSMATARWPRLRCWCCRLRPAMPPHWKLLSRRPRVPLRHGGGRRPVARTWCRERLYQLQLGHSAHWIWLLPKLASGRCSPNTIRASLYSRARGGAGARARLWLHHHDAEIGSIGLADAPRALSNKVMTG